MSDAILQILSVFTNLNHPFFGKFDTFDLINHYVFHSLMMLLKLKKQAGKEEARTDAGTA